MRPTRTTTPTEGRTVSTVASRFTAEDKLHFEALKAKADAEAASRPSYKNPSFWVSGVSALAAVVGIGGQYLASQQKYDQAVLAHQRAELDRQLAEVKRDSAKLDLTATQQQVEELKRQGAQLQQAYDDLKRSTDELKAVREQREKELAEVEKALVGLRANNAVAAGNLVPLERALGSLRNATRSVDSKVQEQSRVLENLEGKIQKR